MSTGEVPCARFQLRYLKFGGLPVMVAPDVSRGIALFCVIAALVFGMEFFIEPVIFDAFEERLMGSAAAEPWPFTTSIVRHRRVLIWIAWFALPIVNGLLVYLLVADPGVEELTVDEQREYFRQRAIVQRQKLAEYRARFGQHYPAPPAFAYLEDDSIPPPVPYQRGCVPSSTGGDGSLDFDAVAVDAATGHKLSDDESDDRLVGTVVAAGPGGQRVQRRTQIGNAASVMPPGVAMFPDVVASGHVATTVVQVPSTTGAAATSPTPIGAIPSPVVPGVNVELVASVQPCYRCNAYIRSFDHHCGVVGACIGEGTFGLFVVFLEAAAALLFLGIVLALAGLNAAFALGHARFPSFVSWLAEKWASSTASPAPSDAATPIATGTGALVCVYFAVMAYLFAFTLMLAGVYTTSAFNGTSTKAARRQLQEASGVRNKGFWARLVARLCTANFSCDNYLQAVASIKRAKYARK